MPKRYVLPQRVHTPGEDIMQIERVWLKHSKPPRWDTYSFVYTSNLDTDVLASPPASFNSSVFLQMKKSLPAGNVAACRVLIISDNNPTDLYWD